MGAEEAEAINQPTNKRIHRDQALGFQLAERHMDGPAMADKAETVEGQVGTFTDAHAGMTNQQKGIATQIVAAEEFLLQEFILLCRKRTWKSSRETRNVFTADQMGEFRKLFGPSQLVEDAAQSDKQVDTGCGREWR